jgi:glycosyltransferase involved in cell wall biosynthesis
MSKDVPGSAPLRVALVTGNLNLGGATSLLLNLTGELNHRGIQTLVFSFEKENPLASDFKADGVKVVFEDEDKSIFEDRLSACLKLLAEFRPSCVVAWLAPPSFEVLRYVPPGILRVGLDVSDKANIYPTDYAPFMDVLVGVSKKIAATARSLPAFGRVDVRCIHCGVPIPEPRQRIPDSSSPLRIIFLGRLYQDSKRVRLFPTILRHLCESQIPFSWTIAGDGPELDFLKTNMQTSRPDQQVHFTGPLSNSEISALLSRHDVFLLASDFEGLPMSLLESMAQGLVPVVSDIESGIREVVDSNNGIRVAIDDIPGYAKAIIHLHENRDALAAMGRAAHDIVLKAYSVRVMADRWLDLVASHQPVSAEWPGKFNIRPALSLEGQIKFHPAFRPPRRLVKTIAGSLKNKNRSHPTRAA